MCSEALKVLDYVYAGMIVVDSDLKIYYWNKWLEIKTFIKKDEIIGSYLSDFFNFIDEEELKRKIKFTVNFKQQSFYTVEPHRFLIDIELTKITDKIFEVMQQNVTITPFDIKITEEDKCDEIFGDISNKKFALIQIDDVTQLEAAKKRLEMALDKLQQQQATLQSQSRLAAMGEIMENITHQWKQPLNTIVSLSNVLSMQLKDKKVINKIKESAEYLHKTVNYFRSFSCDVKQFDSTFNIIESIEKVLGIFDYEGFGVRIKRDFDVKEVFVRGRISEFNQVLLVILNNAKDACMLKKTNEPLVLITLREDHEFVYLTIEDNGTGLSEDVKKKVFEPYFTTKFKDQGTGIGLNMAYNIIKKMNGYIIADNSEKLGGASFKIVLPFYTEEKGEKDG